MRIAGLVIAILVLSMWTLTARSNEPMSSLPQHGIHLGVNDFTVKGAQVYFLPGGKDVVVGGGGGSDTEVRSAANGRLLSKVGSDGFAIAVSANGKRIATAGRQLAVFDRSLSKELMSLPGNNDGVMPVAFSPEADYLAIADNSAHDLSVRKIGANEKVSMKNIGPRYSSLVFSKGGKEIFAGTHEYGIDLAPIDVFDTTTGKKLKSLDAHHRAILGLALSSSGNLLASVSNDGLGIWNLSTGQHRFLSSKPSTSSEPEKRMWSAAISPNEKTIAVGTDGFDPNN